MLIGVHTLMKIKDTITGDELMVALTKKECDELVVNGEFSEKFIKFAFVKYNFAQQKEKGMNKT